MEIVFDTALEKGKLVYDAVQLVGLLLEAGCSFQSFQELLTVEVVVFLPIEASASFWNSSCVIGDLQKIGEPGVLSSKKG